MFGIDIHGLGAILWSFRSYHILCIVRLGDICNALRYSDQYLSFCVFLLAIVLYVLRFTTSDYTFGTCIFKLFLSGMWAIATAPPPFISFVCGLFILFILVLIPDEEPNDSTSIYPSILDKLSWKHPLERTNCLVRGI